MNATAEALPEEVPYKVGKNKPPRETIFTSESARQAIAKRWAKERENKAINPPALPEKLRESDPENELPQIGESDPLKRESDELWEEMKLLRAQIGRAKTSAEKRDLAMARKSLFESWQILTGTERPGTRRTSKAKRDPASGGDPFAGSGPLPIAYPRLFEQRNIPL